MKRRQNVALVALLAAMLSACGSKSTTSTAPPTPFIPFPTHDTPINAASGSQKEVWSAYEVGSIPAQGTPANVPAAPTVVNATNGAVPPEVAQAWGTAFFRDAGWKKWAVTHAEARFLKHIDGSADEFFELQQGQTEVIPDCALWPTSLTLIAVPSDFSGRVIGSDQYAFLATYTPPPTQPCVASFTKPDGQLQEFTSFKVPTVYLMKGWVHKDPLLGDIWVTDARTPCNFQCPQSPKATPGPPPPFPDDDTLITQATLAQQLVWIPYSVALIPRKGVLFGIPKAPTVSNQTHGVIPDDLAQRWAQDMYQQATWSKWALEKAQRGFQAHIGDQSAFNSDIQDAGSKAGLPALPTCAVYPKSISLAIIGDDERHGAAQQATHADEFVMDLQFADPCSVTVTFPDGSSQTVKTAKELISYGSVRDDPFLGEMWYPDAVINPTGFAPGS